MCGIAGILRWKGEPLRPLEIERMTKAINHRGPDGEGFLKRDRVALGHRRLAIIDLQSGQQPMSNGDETIWITYNGEIYNYLELTHELQQKGYRFATRSDTEVVLHAYKEWGPECIKRFRGMFAFGLVDFKDRKILLARDHFGIKPLFYRTGDGYLAFGSELGALRHVDDTPPTGSLEAIDLYLRFQYIPTPHTIYREVHKLPPASYMLIDFDGHSKGPVRYWDLKFQAEDGLSDHDWEERAEAVIQDSVKAHLVADVPFGVFLSGGIDSSLIALEMSRILQRPLQAFTIGFDEKPYSEIEYAKEAAKRCGVELCSEIVRGDALRILPDLVSHYGEPFGDSSAIPTWYVSRLARRHVPMVLSGDGGDEAFGGYDSYANWIGAHPALRARRLVRSAPRASFRLMLQTMRRFLVGGSLNNLAEWQKHILYVGEKHRRLLWRDQYQDLPGLGCQVFEEAGRKAHRWNRLAYAQYLDYQTYLPCDILTKVDVASMYHGLEVRPPLVDVRVVELAARLPYDQRFGRNGSEGPVRKKLLKRILGKTFPAEFVHRKKQGFAIPAATWFLPGNSGRKLVEQVLTDPFSRLNSFFEPTQIRSYLQRHNEDKDTSGTLWLLLVLGLWLEQNPEVHF